MVLKVTASMVIPGMIFFLEALELIILTAIPGMIFLLAALEMTFLLAVLVQIPLFGRKVMQALIT